MLLLVLQFLFGPFAIQGKFSYFYLLTLAPSSSLHLLHIVLFFHIFTYTCYLAPPSAAFSWSDGTTCIYRLAPHIDIGIYAIMMESSPNDFVAACR